MNNYVIKYFSEIHIGQVVVRDPVTAVTNILIFLAGWWSWKQIRRSKIVSVKSWSLFFLFIGLSSLIGVVVHGFSFYTPLRTHFWIWVVMGLVQNVGVSFAQIATAQRYFPRQSKWIIALVLIQFIVAGLAFIHYEHYKWVKWHIALGLLPVMGWYFYRWSNGDLKAKWIAIGIAISGITVAVHSFKISISEEWFNFNDIAHLLIVASLLVMVKGLAANDES